MYLVLQLVDRGLCLMQLSRLLSKAALQRVQLLRLTVQLLM